ncbi:glutathione S-transferase [Methylotenera sp. 1P/1]|uniref:glutathione S-transferase n=1 Tax=Methylotenera sp. 1P/1 TaxID=1131551 RepID=UPI000475DD61|nr:glutathione S-transferase [Methylotenera sp. 1P/1]
MQLPILYSYRRCPYAMRARMALHVSNIQVEIREISLRDKPTHMLQMSPKGTVPVLVLENGLVLEQSLDIMMWALQQHDPEGWLHANHEQTMQWITNNDGDFKQALDHYKYPERFPEQPQVVYRVQCEIFLQTLESALQAQPYLMGQQVSIADIAIFPFIRQFAAVDATWFSQSPYVAVAQWLSAWVESTLFVSIMQKYPVYQS